ncbi:MAG TPA: hypothetical protein VHP31_12220 [Caproicibacter sp.]|nr:hypothetical protein [Caproicibacter sp.]
MPNTQSDSFKLYGQTVYWHKAFKIARKVLWGMAILLIAAATIIH